MTERTLTVEEKRAAAEAKRRRAATRAKRAAADAAAAKRTPQRAGQARGERAAAKPSKRAPSAKKQAAKKSTAKKPASKTTSRSKTTAKRPAAKKTTARTKTAARASATTTARGNVSTRSRSAEGKPAQTRRPATTAKTTGAPKRGKKPRPVTKAARPAAKALDSISAIEPIIEVGDARRRVTAADAIGGVFVAYLVAALLGSGGLVGLAERQPIGTGRTVAMGAAAATDRVANLFSLNRPADALSAALADSGTGSEPAPVKVATPVTRPEEEVVAPAATRQDSPLPPITPSRPLKMWVGGDSMVRELSDALLGEVPFDTVPLWKDNFRVSSGLSRPDFHDWPEQIASDMVAEEPDAVVIMFGANDFQDFEVAGGAILSRGTPEWLAEYQRRVSEVMEILDQPGTRVTWVGQPVMRSDQLSQGMAQMNTIYAEEALLRERITFLNTWDLFTDGSGAYSLYLADVDGDEKRMRQEDGIHLSIAGAERMARAVWVEVANDWTFPE